MKKKFLLYSLFAALLSLSVASCKDSKNEPSQTTIYSTSPTSAQLTHFALKPNVKVLANLDSVHFVIDQQKGLVYNVDSLPMGTNVTRLLVSLQFGTSVNKAQFVVSNGEVIKEEKTIDYSDTSTDSIDFSGNVILKVTSANGQNVKSYQVNVNVHTENPDTLLFPMTDRRDLPAAGDSNYGMGMVQYNGLFYSLVNNSNGRYVCTATTPAGKWSTEKVELPFVPVEKSLAATNDAMYVLDENGNLYTSQDAKSWTSTGAVWTSILGAYGDRLLGLTRASGTLCSDEYPRHADFSPVKVPEGFPVEGYSQMMVVSNDWAINPVAIMVGGVDEHGKMSNATWGYDGKIWAQVNSNANNSMPAITGATLVSYCTYELNNVTQVAIKKNTWLVMGGRLADGTFNRKTYTSRNLGITWTEAATSLQLPNYIPAFSGALGFVCTETKSLKSPSRIAKPITEWEVPYVYIVGGSDAHGMLLNNVWKGTITRLTYRPLY